MRLELQMELLKPEIDIDYRRIIISYLKFALEHCEGGRFFEKFYKNRDNIVKDYCFSTVFSKPRFTKEKIYFDKNEMKIIFSCSDRNRTGLIFQTAFLAIQHMKFPLANENHMILRKIIQKKEVLITEPVVYFQTMLGNGLCVREHNRETNRDTFITCEDKEFSEKTELIIKNQLQMAGFYKKQYEDIKVEPVDCKKIVVKHYGIFIDLTVGILKISGDMNALQYLYQSGAGSHHATGFGSLNVIRQGGKMNER